MSVLKGRKPIPGALWCFTDSSTVSDEFVDPVELARDIWLGTIPGHGLTVSLAMRGPVHLK
jgi:hypothetical protein